MPEEFVHRIDYVMSISSERHTNFNLTEIAFNICG